jgi:hypothetical protein
MDQNAGLELDKLVEQKQQIHAARERAGHCIFDEK